MQKSECLVRDYITLHIFVISVAVSKESIKSLHGSFKPFQATGHIKINFFFFLLKLSVEYLLYSVMQKYIKQRVIELIKFPLKPNIGSKIFKNKQKPQY